MSESNSKLILFSGGIESTTLVANSLSGDAAASRYFFCNIRPVPRPRDLDAVERLAAHFGIDYEMFDLSSMTRVQRAIARYVPGRVIPPTPTDWGKDGWWARVPSPFLVGLTAGMFYAQLIGAERVELG